jgi:hypothetical protein
MSSALMGRHILCVCVCVCVCVEEHVNENAGWCKTWPHANAVNIFYCGIVMT